MSQKCKIFAIGPQAILDCSLRLSCKCCTVPKYNIDYMKPTATDTPP